MTSQKSSKNNVNRNDFVRSLTGSILFPAIALVVLFIAMTIPVISYVTSDAYKMVMAHEEVSMFIAPNSVFEYMFSLLPTGMVFCGMLTAIKSFYFMLSKKQVNVFFSLGVTRKTMFVNRTLAGIITLFIAVLVPMLVIYLINIACFGYVAHATQIFLYIVSLFFTCGLAGFAIGAAATMIGGNIFEVTLTSFSASFLPSLTVSVGGGIINSFLKGYVNSGSVSWWLGLVSPYYMLCTVNPEDVVNNYGYVESRNIAEVLSLLTRNGVDADKFVIPDTAKVDMGFITPILVWFAISVVLIAVGYILYKVRKAEHANSFGHFAISRAINTAIVFGFLAFLIDEMFWRQIGPVVYFIILAIVSLIAYFVIQLVMTRKLKTTLKSLKWYGVLISVTAVFLALVGTGFFGTFNKTPDKSEIKSVSIDATELSPFEHYLGAYDADEDFVEGTSDNSKEVILGIFDKIKNEKVRYGEDSFLGVTFAFRDNNDQIKYRVFHIYSEELYVEYLKAVYGSDFFDEILKEYLLNDPPAIDEEFMGEMEMVMDDNKVVYYGDINKSSGYLKTKQWAFLGSTGLYELDENLVPQTEYIADSEELCKALYNDLTKMTYEQLFERTEKPIGILGVFTSDSMGSNVMHKDEMVYPTNGEFTVVQITGEYGLVSRSIPVYLDMTETVAFLTANGYMSDLAEFTIQEVLYTDSPLNIDDALQKFYKANESTYDKHTGYNYWIYDTVNDIVFTSDDLFWGTFDATSAFITEQMTNVDMLKRVYKDAGHPLTSVTDTAKAEAIAEKSVSQYMISGDNGRYVYVIYEEGPIVCYYLPEANVSVLK